MTDTPSQPDAKLDALFATVARHSDEQCREIDRDAETQACDIVARAHRDARVKVHEAIVEERRNGARAIGQQRARIETAKRHNLQDKENAFLDAAWQQLTAALRTRWRDEAARRDWVGGVVELALSRLHPGAWKVEHPADWSPTELDPFMEKITSMSGAAPQFEAVPELELGIRIAVNSVTIDGGLAGVTADRNEVSAMLLAQLFQDAKDAP